MEVERANGKSDDDGAELPVCRPLGGTVIGSDVWPRSIWLVEAVLELILVYRRDSLATRCKDVSIRIASVLILDDTDARLDLMN